VKGKRKGARHKAVVKGYKKKCGFFSNGREKVGTGAAEVFFCNCYLI
jgi:hypothetical protein